MGKFGLGIPWSKPKANRVLSREHTAAAKSLQSCLTLCDPRDCSLPGFSVHGILQVGTLEWVAISFSNAWKWKVKVKSLSRVWLLATPWTVAHQAPPSMGFSGQRYWSGVPLPSPFTFHTRPKKLFNRKYLFTKKALTSLITQFIIAPNKRLAKTLVTLEWVICGLVTMIAIKHQ